MHPIFLLISIILIVLQFKLPRNYAFLPLIIAGAHLSQIEIIPQFSPARLIIIAGLYRAYSNGHLHFSLSSLADKIALAFVVYLAISGLGHESSSFIPNPVIYRIGFGFNLFGAYLYGKAYLDSAQSLKHYALAILFVLAPLALFMSSQQATGLNPYGYIGSASFYTIMRNGELRAAGPFSHAILAGCCGACALPFVMMLYRAKKRILAGSLFFVAWTIVVACNSSGPLAAVAVSMAAIVAWKWRGLVPLGLISAGAALTVHQAQYGRGPWHIMAQIDFTGGSTGYYRAYLISAAIKYFGEWWLIGSDYTRHWMQTGVSATPNHCDLVNYYIHLGVLGGFPSTALFSCLLGIALKRSYQLSKTTLNIPEDEKYAVWTLSVVLATHTISMVSISYFDQMFIFLYLFIGSAISISENPNAFTKDENEPT